MTKPLLCLFAVFALPSLSSRPVQAQTQEPQPPLASLTATADLPEAPLPAYSLQVVSSSAEQVGQSSSATSPQQEPSKQETEADRRKRADEQVQQEEHQRIAGIVPNFNSVQNGQALPLTPGQKFHLFFRGSIDPYQFALAGIDAGIEEIEDSYPEYHHGFPGFARRYGAAYADSWDGNFWGNAVLPSLLHQDPRYYRLGRESGKSAKYRFLYAASTTVLCHSDSGKRQVNYSNIIGNFIGGAISNVYYPASDRGVALTLERGITVTGEGTFGAELIEFYPDFVAWRQRRHERKLAERASNDGAGRAQDVTPPATAAPPK